MNVYVNETGTFIYGKRDDIKKTLKGIKRASAKNKTSLTLPYKRFPIFAKNKQMYALHLDKNNFVHVLSSDSMMAILHA